MHEHTHKKTIGKLLMKIFLALAMAALAFAAAAWIAIGLVYHNWGWNFKEFRMARNNKEVRDKKCGQQNFAESKMDFKITINQDQKMEQTVAKERILPRTFGVIKKIDGRKISIINNAGQAEDVFSQPYTVITLANRQISLAELKVGQKALFIGTNNGLNQLGAESIDVSN